MGLHNLWAKQSSAEKQDQQALFGSHRQGCGFCHYLAALGRSTEERSSSETTMTTTTFPIQQPAGLVTHDLEGHDNIYAKEPQMTMAAADAGWGFHDRAEKLNGRLAMVGFLAALVTELATGEGLLHAIGL